MTRQGWAERKVRALQQRHNSLCLIEIAEVGILAEHKRAVRVVKRKIADLEAIKSRSVCNAEISEAYASVNVLRDILAALQRGRE